MNEVFAELLQLIFMALAADITYANAVAQMILQFARGIPEHIKK